MKKIKDKTDYVSKLKEVLVDVDFNKKPKKVTLKELNKRAEKARKLYNFELYETSIRSRLST